LLSAARREPSTEGGFLASPGGRSPGCPFAPRCDRALPSCAAWALWQGKPDDGFRCERPLP
ncbi:MAG TPA: hypothetical protein VFF77_01420, partial [Holophagaceae bacterium]|nr:hypothetical protein [Holophagaceae bacterium]